MSPDAFSARKPARQSRARETVDAILDAAARLVMRDHTTRLSTNRIAEIAGVSIGSLYQYFPGKDAILHALVQREFNRVVDGHVQYIASIDTDTTSLEDAIGGIVAFVFAGQSVERPLYRQLLMSVLSVRHLLFTLENDARVRAAVMEKLARYGQVDHAGLDAAMFVAQHSMKGVQIGAVLANQTLDNQALRAAMTRALVACVAPGVSTVAERRV